MAAEAPGSKKSSAKELFDSSPDELAKEIGERWDKARFGRVDKWMRPNAAFAYWPVSIALAFGFALFLRWKVEVSWKEAFIWFLVMTPIFIFGNAARIASFRYPDKEE